MKVLPAFIILSLLVIQLPARAQQKSNTLFEDFDLFSMQPIRHQADSVPALIKYSASKSQKPRKLEVLLYKDEWPKLQTRKALITQNKLGTIIGFNKYKGMGFERVIIFGARDQYLDSMLVRHDTIFYKQLINNESLYLQMILPAKNDSLVIKTMHINYEADEYRYDPGIHLKDYAGWFDKTNYYRSEVYTLVKAGDHFELTGIKTMGKQREDYACKYLQRIYRRVGLSPFWVAVWPNLIFL
jgi:hypothetical protein